LTWVGLCISVEQKREGNNLLVTNIPFLEILLGEVLRGTFTIEKVAEMIYTDFVNVASGQRVKAEKSGYDQTVEIYTTGPTI
jgi:altronate dehydratase